MKKTATFLLLFSLFHSFLYAQSKKDYKVLTVAFYNVENLFDTENDPFTFDDDRTPTSKDVWTMEKYEDKLHKIAQVISEIGSELTASPPAIIGLCEVENLKVLEDLVAQPQLSQYNYGIVHYDSPDRRGVDVALLYRKSIFNITDSQSRRLVLYEVDEPSKRVFTRDQLVVSGSLDGEQLSFIVNHWPSRSGGQSKSNYKRLKAAELNKRILDSLWQIDPYAKILNMGDFNDDPHDKSIKKGLNAIAEKTNLTTGCLYNPMEKLAKKGAGTLAYRDNWNLFDQIMLSSSLITDEVGFSFFQAGIFTKSYMLTPSGQYKGYPFRSFGSAGYEGGYSDHFPVYVYLIKPQTGN